MDFDLVEAFIWSLDNYFALTGLTNEYQRARFAATRLSKSAALWMRNQEFDFDHLVWTDLRAEIRRYFRPADFHRRARDSLANCVQTKGVPAYIYAVKKCAQRLPEVTDDELLDRFVRGLKANVQIKVLKEDPHTFDEACRLAERVARLDQLAQDRALPYARRPAHNQGNNQRGQQRESSNSHHVPMDVDNM